MVNGTRRHALRRWWAPPSARGRRLRVVLVTLGAALGLLSGSWLGHRADAAPPPLSLELRLDRPLVHVAPPPTDPGEGQELRRAYVRIRVAATRQAAAAPLHVALVVDRAVLGGGDAVSALGRLGEPFGAPDLLTVLAFDDTVEVLAPPGPAADGQAALARLSTAQPGGHGPANLFGAVAKAAAELRRFTGPARVSHVIVVSARAPGLGPQRPTDLAELGTKLVKDGLGVSALQVGDGPDDALRALARGGAGNFSGGLDVAGVPGAVDDIVKRLRSVRARGLRIAVSFDGETPPLRVIGGFGELTRPPAPRLVTTWSELAAPDSLELFAELDMRRCEPGRHAFASAELHYFDVQLNRAVSVSAPLAGECRIGDPAATEMDYEVAAAVAVAVAEEAREAARVALAESRRDGAARAFEAALRELRGPLLAERHPDIMALADELEAELGALGGGTPGRP